MAEAIEILVIEDNPGDVRLVQEGLREHGVHYQMHVVDDGEQALAYLRRQGMWKQAPRPSLIFMDLKLPRMDGLSVLPEIKRDEDLRRSPVIVWTSSAAPDDVMKSYDRGANGYVRKPEDFQACVAALGRIIAFWFGTAILPSKS